jgi:AraC family transcriptional regulator
MHVSAERLSDTAIKPSGFRSSLPSIVDISPPDIARRRLANWGAIQADTVRITRRETFEYSFKLRDTC